MWVRRDHYAGNITLDSSTAYAEALIAVACGALLGATFGREPYLGGLRNEDLGWLGLLVVTLLKTLAIPLIFFAILDALIRISLPLRQGSNSSAFASSTFVWP